MKKEFSVPADMDDECKALCFALNTIEHVETIESCCGHGERPYRIWFKAPPVALKHVAYHVDRCHCGQAGWRVIATTDCSRRPVTYMLEGPVGLLAYKSAAKIADAIIMDEDIYHEDWEGNIGLTGAVSDLNEHFLAVEIDPTTLRDEMQRRVDELLEDFPGSFYVFCCFQQGDAENAVVLSNISEPGD